LGQRDPLEGEWEWFKGKIEGPKGCARGVKNELYANSEVEIIHFGKIVALYLKSEGCELDWRKWSSKK
jgi:hypothetical protein